MSNLTQFTFKSNQVRVEIKDDQPLFCLKDVADVLNIKNVSQVAQTQLKEKGIYKIYTLTNGGKQEVIFINEPNLYRVIFRSNKKEAVDFQNWVFEDVLPQIRKTGSYGKLASPSEKQQIKQAVNIAKHRTGRTYQNIYTVLFNYLSINKLDALTHKDFDRALAYINRLETIEYPQQTASLPAPAPVPTPQPAQPRLLDVADLFKQRIDTKLHRTIRSIEAMARTFQCETADALQQVETLMEELKHLDLPRKHLL